jgi:omega-6 fatty acid desaturase (delta-12 desaturase)
MNNYSASISLKNLRQLLKPHYVRKNKLALFIIVMDGLFFWFGQYLIIVLPNYLKLLAAIFVGFIIFRLFVLAHDASHGSFTTSKRLNYWLAQLAFLPGLTTYQGWSKSHNLTHHGFTNLATKDNLWKPFGVDEYNNLTDIGKLQYKIYRTPLGGCLYYFLEVWAKILYLPTSKEAGNYKNKRFISEFIFVSVCFFSWLSMLFFIAIETKQNYFLLLFFSVLVPFFVFNSLASFIIYLHHNNPNIRWYREQTEWINSVPHITATVHLRFADWFSTATHHIMEHPAHHLAAAIPSYNLKAAQRVLEEALPEQIIIQNFSWKWYLECTRICKLYDFEKHEWVGFPEKN